MPMSCDGDDCLKEADGTDCLKVAAKESLNVGDRIYLPLSVGNDARPPAKKAIYGSDRAKLRPCFHHALHFDYLIFIGELVDEMYSVKALSL
ncbi:unnamed protein product [Brassica rapa]|uniref:Uncharacterized protein n=1 Tax=Brassica campestris TaxID=3711 RepID=A0A3P5YX81_BRACM|nr:unnamed protein product [Brassica rapa]VDC72382.1 unnamed protein product [Brassica rapa]